MMNGSKPDLDLNNLNNVRIHVTTTVITKLHDKLNCFLHFYLHFQLFMSTKFSLLLFPICNWFSSRFSLKTYYFFLLSIRKKVRHCWQLSERPPLQYIFHLLSCFHSIQQWGLNHFDYQIIYFFEILWDIF